MKRRMLLAVGLLLFGVAIAPSRDQRANLLPKLQPGQTLTYLVRYRSTKNVKTASTLVVPLAPTPSQADTHGLLRIQILDLQQTGDKLAIHARSQFLNDDALVPAAKPASGKSKSEQPLQPEGNPVDFTISPEGFAEKITGLDALTPEQQQIWQEWLARFAMAWAIPAQRDKIGDKWKIEQPEPAASPIAALTWVRDSSYVRDAPCSPAQLSVTGEATYANSLTDTCAVLLTTAKLVQKSSPKDATPEDFKLHQLKTMGTAKGSNELITYISLTTGLVVRATEDASQRMDVMVAKADGSNAVRYHVDAKSQLEVLLLTQAQVSGQH
ncbi:MAG: hypothetical protein DMG39_21535 [Acidobacteria bacterium]|nr:MAG: hypothetical protein DMG39_21535 [Acidobacteriota bacterium]